jgi:hypothetical protein
MARCFPVRTLCLGLLIALPSVLLAQQTKPRARDWGIPFGGTPGPLNAITDIKGIEVGQVTLIEGEESFSGQGSGHTGVTAILPRGRRIPTGLRRLVDPERQRRNDRDDVGRRVRVPVGLVMITNTMNRRSA